MDLEDDWLVVILLFFVFFPLVSSRGGNRLDDSRVAGLTTSFRMEDGLFHGDDMILDVGRVVFVRDILEQGPVGAV